MYLEFAQVLAIVKLRLSETFHTQWKVSIYECVMACFNFNLFLIIKSLTVH